MLRCLELFKGCFPGIGWCAGGFPLMFQCLCSRVLKSCFLFLKCSVVCVKPFYGGVQAFSAIGGRFFGVRDVFIADMGRALEVDPYIKVPQRQVWSTGVAWRWHTWSKDTTGYAKAYNYPVISAGLMVTDYSRVRVKQPDFLPGREPSKLGTSWVGFMEFDWPVVRPSRNTSVSFALRNGLGRSTRTWHRENNPENELIGSPWSVYFGAAFYAAWQTGRWTLRVGPEFHHLSNGAVARPNKGVNSVGLGVSAAYCIDGEREKVPDTKEPLVPFDDKGLFLELDWRTGLKTALGEWLVDKKNQNAGRPMAYGSYSLYVAYGVSAALMYRYDRRFASGIGLDLIHEPYLGRIEVQNPERPRSVQKQSWGMNRLTPIWICSET